MGDAEEEGSGVTDPSAVPLNPPDATAAPVTVPEGEGVEVVQGVEESESVELGLTVYVPVGVVDPVPELHSVPSGGVGVFEAVVEALPVLPPVPEGVLEGEREERGEGVPLVTLVEVEEGLGV